MTNTVTGTGGGERIPAEAGPRHGPGRRSAAVDHERKAPGRPRSPRTDEVIIDAVLDLLAEGTSAEALAIETVATRAGVGKATIYRRWPNKEALLIDAVAAVKGPVPEISGTDLRSDLVALLRPAGCVESTRASQIIPGLIAHLHRSPQLQRCYQHIVEPRRDVMRQLLWRGVRSGELRADLDVEVAMSMLLAPMIVQALMNWNPVLDVAELSDRLVAAVWPALVAPPGAAAAPVPHAPATVTVG